MNQSLKRNLFAVLLGLLPSLLMAGELPSRFTLGKYVPDDCWMYIHGVHNPESAWVYDKWGEVFAELKKSGIDKDLKGVIVSMLGDEERAKFEAGMTKVMNLLGGVNWGDMFQEEMVIAERIYAGIPGYEYMLLARGKEGSGEKNVSGLLAMLREVTSWNESLKVVDSKVEGVEVWKVRLVDKKEADITIDVGLFRKGDIVGIALGRTYLESVPAMLAGKSQVKPIVHSARFKEATALLPSAEDAIMFFDWKGFVSGLNGLIGSGFARSKDPADAQTKAMIDKAVKMIDFADYMATSTVTDGPRQTTHHATKLISEKPNCPLAAIAYDRKPFDRFDKFVPADATGFSVDTFIDVEGLYKTVLTFLEDNVADGKNMTAQWRGMLAQVGFDPDRDLFSWWSGETISVDMPASIPTPMMPTDSVMMIRVKNSELAAEKVNKAIDMLTDVVAAMGQPLTVKASESMPGFREVTYGPLAMMMRPVIGVKDEWLIVSSSTAAVEKCLAVASGKAPSIATNERFKAEGIVPKGPVLSASFTDTSKMGQEMAQVLGPIAMGIGFAGAGIPSENPEARKMKELFPKLAGMLMKLQPVVSKIDFYSSEAAVTFRDGALIRSQNVVTYKADAMEKVKTAAASNGSAPK